MYHLMADNLSGGQRWLDLVLKLTVGCGASGISVNNFSKLILCIGYTPSMTGYKYTLYRLESIQSMIYAVSYPRLT